MHKPRKIGEIVLSLHCLLMERYEGRYSHYRTFCHEYKLIHIKTTTERYHEEQITRRLYSTSTALGWRCFRFVHFLFLSVTCAAVESLSCCWMPGRTHLRRIVKNGVPGASTPRFSKKTVTIVYSGEVEHRDSAALSARATFGG